MEFDYERGKQKEEEVLESIKSYLVYANLCEAERRQVAEIIVSTSIRVTPPEKEQVAFYRLVTLDPSGRGGGKSTKLGNIRLNVGKLMEGVANGTFAVVSSYQVPWLAPFAFILLWKSLRKSVQVDLTENDAAVIYAMWVYRDRDNNEISEVNLLGNVNCHLTKYDRLPISQKDLQFSISNLAKIGSIQQSSKNPGNWWLCEWVQPVYR